MAGLAAVTRSAPTGRAPRAVPVRSGARPRRRAVATVLGAAVAGALGAGAVSAGPATAATAVAAAGRSGDATAGGTGAATPLGYDPDDTGSMSAVTRIVGAQAAWAAGWTGAGVDVAVIDTGVSPVAGLDLPGKLVTGPDLSFDAPGAPTPGLDAYGHGTFMASLIAGRDATATRSATGCTTCLTASGYSDTTAFVGIAPDARIVDVKVGAADGTTDVTQVIAAIDWVTQHAHDPGLNIRVISLSYGSGSAQPYTADPLAHAAEQAWRHGIVVVAAAGNDGRSAPTLADPAYDPYLLAVGADDPEGTIAPDDDTVPRFAEHGTLARPVDLVAPGVHVLGLRVPGSFVDSQAGNTGRVGTRFQRGSGTSQATAIVAGVAALVAQRYPLATPDQLKALLTATATPLPRVPTSPALAQAATAHGMTLSQYATWVNALNALHSGKGLPDAGRAVAAPLPDAVQTAVPSTGAGTLDGSRAGTYVTDHGVALTGQRDIFGRPYASATMASARVLGQSWTGGAWNGSRWTGDGWAGGDRTGTAWAGTAWTGTDWAGTRWTGLGLGMTWDGGRWSGPGWTGSRWTGCSWDGSRWSSSSWA